MKKVFEYMGWCQHRYANNGKLWGTGICTRCKDPLPKGHPLDGNDMVEAINKMQKNGDWECFYEYCLEYVLEHFPKITKVDNRAWLFGNPTNFFKLMEEWLNEKAD